MMEWNGNLRMPFVSRAADPSNLSFLYNCSFDPFPAGKSVDDLLYIYMFELILMDCTWW